MLDLPNLLRFALALAIVLALIVVVAWVAKRLLGGGVQGLGRQRRLTLVETLPIDGKSRLAIVRRDDVEHLLYLGPSGSTLIEAGFAPPRNAARAAPPVEDANAP